ncbi:TetR family transcriptional regulator [Acinetobacter sp. ANC 4558]|uniref:TetR/AcrR family transcriptional regulator n=1 Tax=Acinetobacter sp. ANC 4558 TaxID=1977876 RepID=UPI000A336A08|nr:TetR/AcrR family transcriptional regulator [Acinetobacter sp. ANC 4558]OTG81861.1 TetR family transcriptional regulator [Acinetobacter sp. ANC 4558]
MKEIQQSKKQPHIIRKRILEQAIILASQRGISGISIQNVANGAGVTKGGVFHHFANKQILIEEMMNEILYHLDLMIESTIQQDHIDYGQFTRAYIQSAFESEIAGLVSPWSALAMTMITDTTFNIYWSKWFNHKLLQYSSTDDYPELAFIRLATDGLWLSWITNSFDKETCIKLKTDLINRTYLTH